MKQVMAGMGGNGQYRLCFAGGYIDGRSRIIGEVKRMNFKNEVVHEFEKVITKYNLQVKCFSNNEIVLFSPQYILSFLLHSAELELVYIEKREDGELFQYNIDSFIANSISTEDRMFIKEKIAEKSTIEKELALLAYILGKKWDELLSGGMEWIKEYQKFILYIPPRNVTKLKEYYVGKCI